MNNIRSWIFRVLVLIGVGLMVYTWFQPWWIAHVIVLNADAVKVFPYGMTIDLGGNEAWVEGADEVMPGWFTPFMWVYLGLCVVALLASLFVSSEKRVGFGRMSLSLPKALISGVGLSYIIVAISAVAVISANAPSFYDAPLMGTVYVYISQHEASDVKTSLEFAYWLAWGTGLFLVILGLLRNKIIGKIK